MTTRHEAASACAGSFTFFWSHREDAVHPECGQFYPRPVILAGSSFNCCEQWMHWRKAPLFDDATTAAAILAETSPMKQKLLGRQVAGFSRTIWNSVARDIVFRGNVAKFSQHADLLERLRRTCGTLLVEVSPMDAVWDAVWGIGVASTDPLASRRETWPGTNWLGEMLTEVRASLCGD